MSADQNISSLSFQRQKTLDGKYRRILFISIFFGILFLVSCNPSRSIYPTETLTLKTATITPTNTRTLTPTPFPILTAHTWQPSNILILRNRLKELLLSPPDFVLYSDGQLMISQGSRGPEGERRVYVRTIQLDRKGVCKLLNAIDQTGLFYDDTFYFPEEASPTDGSYEYLEVNAWGSSRVSGYDMTYAAREYRTGCVDGQNSALCKYYVSPGVVDTLFLLESYLEITNHPLESMQKYNPDKIAIRVAQWKREAFDVLPPPWPFQSPSLAELYTKAPGKESDFRVPQITILEREDAQRIYELIGEVSTSLWPNTPPGLFFTENGIVYDVYILPLLPYQIPSKPGDDQPEFERLTQPYELSCQPSDGMI
jgi:hypothetical protein